MRSLLRVTLLLVLSTTVVADEVVPLEQPLPYTYESSLFSGRSPGNHHVLLPYQHADGSWSWWLDGKLIGRYDELPNDSAYHPDQMAYHSSRNRALFQGRWPLWSEDGRRWIAGARKGDRWIMVLDGVDQPGTVAGWATFSLDGSRVGWLDLDGNERVVVVDGERSPGGRPPYSTAASRPESVFFSPDASRVGWWRMLPGGGRREVIVVDGKAGEPSPHIGNPVFSHDSKRFAYVASSPDHDTMRLIVDHQPVRSHELIDNYRFLPDGRLIYCASDRDQYRVIVGGVPGPAFTDIALREEGTVVPGRLAYTGYRLRGDNLLAWAVVDGTEHGPYSSVGPDDSGLPRFSPDGSKAVWVAEKRDGYCVVVDGVEGPLFEDISGSSIRFSPDSSRMAYSARSGNQAYAVVDGRLSSPWNTIDYQNMDFTSDGRLVYFARDEIGRSFVVIGDEVIDNASLPSVGPGDNIVFLRDGVVHINGRRSPTALKMIGNPSNAGYWSEDGSFNYYVYDSAGAGIGDVRIHRVTLVP